MLTKCSRKIRAASDRSISSAGAGHQEWREAYFDAPTNDAICSANAASKSERVSARGQSQRGVRVAEVVQSHG
jgi:hypothetical protein